MTNKQVSELGKKYGASPRTIRRWAEELAPLDSDAKMLEWLQSRKHLPKGFTEPSKPGEPNWSKELKKYQAMREAIRLQRERGEVLPAKAIQEQTGAALAILFGSLERIFCSEFPASCKGMDELGIRERARESIEEFRAKLLARFGEVQMVPKEQAIKKP